MRKLNERQTAALIKITCTVPHPADSANVASWSTSWCNQGRHGPQCLRQKQGFRLLYDISDV